MKLEFCASCIWQNFHACFFSFNTNWQWMLVHFTSIQNISIIEDLSSLSSSIFELLQLHKKCLDLVQSYLYLPFQIWEEVTGEIVIKSLSRLNIFKNAISIYRKSDCYVIICVIRARCNGYHICNGRTCCV